jgi:hypothetical protein
MLAAGAAMAGAAIGVLLAPRLARHLNATEDST